MNLGSSSLGPPGPGASTFDAFSYAGMMVVGSLSLLLLLSLNVIGVWWVIRTATRPKPAVPQANEDGPGWSDHAQRVVASEREVARLRAEHPDVPTP